MSSDLITKLEHTIEITAALKTKQDKISTDVLSIHNSLKESSESISKQCDQLSQRVDASRTMLADAMNKEFRRLFIQTEDIKRNISKNEIAIEKLGKQIADQYASNRKSILINRWLIFIAILAPFALKVIRFIIHKFWECLLSSQMPLLVNALVLSVILFMMGPHNKKRLRPKYY